MSTTVFKFVYNGKRILVLNENAIEIVIPSKRISVQINNPKVNKLLNKKKRKRIQKITKKKIRFKSHMVTSTKITIKKNRTKKRKIGRKK